MARRRERKVMCSVVLQVVSEGRPVRAATAHSRARNVGRAIAKAKARALEQLKICPEARS